MKFFKKIGFFLGWFLVINLFVVAQPPQIPIIYTGYIYENGILINENVEILSSEGEIFSSENPELGLYIVNIPSCDDELIENCANKNDEISFRIRTEIVKIINVADYGINRLDFFLDSENGTNIRTSSNRDSWPLSEPDVNLILQSPEEQVNETIPEEEIEKYDDNETIKVATMGVSVEETNKDSEKKSNDKTSSNNIIIFSIIVLVIGGIMLFKKLSRKI